MTQVRRLGRDQDSDLRAYFAVQLEAQLDHRAVPPSASYDDWRINLDDPDEPTTIWGAYRNGELLGGAAGITFVHGNEHLMAIELRVLPAHRRAGVGTELLRSLAADATDQSKHTLLAEVVEPAGIPLSSSPGARFAAAHGFTTGLVELHRVIDLPVPLERFDALAAHAARRSIGYTLIAHGNRCPDEHVDAVCAMLTSFMEETPTGDLEVGEDSWTPQRLRAAEDRRERQGRRQFATLALDPSGRAVGLTYLFKSAATDGKVTQADTLVVPQHRGHRLGLAMKVANLRRMQDALPEATYVGTWNAEVNDAMVRVNEQLGATPRERMLDVQRRVDGRAVS
ncbi:MAG: GNAT family N-acetyltransferase [Nocardioidaceae bacterium]